MDTETLAVARETSWLAMIERAAKDPSIDVAKMEKLLELAERVHARQAEAQFDAAMNAAQSEMRPIATDSDNPQTRSRYASYGALDRAVRPVYSAHGFSLSFGTRSTVADRVTITCRVSHRAGHTERVEIDMPADGKGAKGGDVMTKTHATGSAVSYGMRYLLKMIFNLAIGEYDDDGNSAGRTQKPPQSARKPQSEPSERPPQQNAPKAKLAASPAHLTRMLELLKAGPGGEHRELVTEYFRKCDALLPEAETLDDLPLRYVPVDKEQMGKLTAAIAAFEAGGLAELAFPPAQEPLAPKIPKPKPAAEPKGEAFKDFIVPYGKHAGKRLGDLETKTIWGFWNGHTVETEYNGKPKRAETIARDQAFRDALDAAGRHYEFTKKD